MAKACPEGARPAKGFLVKVVLGTARPAKGFQVKAVPGMGRLVRVFLVKAVSGMARPAKGFRGRGFRGAARPVKGCRAVELRGGPFPGSLGLGVRCRGKVRVARGKGSRLGPGFRGSRGRACRALVCRPGGVPPRWAGRGVVGRSSRSEGRGGVGPKPMRGPTVSMG
ncbi:hypothetical protein ACQPZJ_39145 [Actinoplanes sp. CA-054009]